MLAVVLPLDEKPGPAAVKITKHWHAPVGGILIAASGFYALLGFPLDDVWHRLFGQDVTLWGPDPPDAHHRRRPVAHRPARARAGGARRHRRHGVKRGAKPVVLWVLRVAALGGMLIGLSVFQAEYDFGVPQFRLVPAADDDRRRGRLRPRRRPASSAGRGAAVGAAVFFLSLRGVISLIVGPGLGEPTPSLPLYLGSAVLVELLALTSLLRNPLAFGAVGGLLIARSARRPRPSGRTSRCRCRGPPTCASRACS
jgi:hypothetical protein